MVEPLDYRYHEESFHLTAFPTEVFFQSVMVIAFLCPCSLFFPLIVRILRFTCSCTFFKPVGVKESSIPWLFRAHTKDPLSISSECRVTKSLTFGGSPCLGLVEWAESYVPQEHRNTKLASLDITPFRTCTKITHVMIAFCVNFHCIMDTTKKGLELASVALRSALH